MQRTEIAGLCKYADEMLFSAKLKPELSDILISLAENHLKQLLATEQVVCISPVAGFVHCRLGLVKWDKGDYAGAEKCFLDALGNLVVRGDYCQDRALSHWYLGKIYSKLGKKENSKENFIRAIHIYDSLSMFNQLQLLEKDFRELGYKIENFLPAKSLTAEGKPAKCRECGGERFALIESSQDRYVYECLECRCRNIVLKEMLMAH